MAQNKTPIKRSPQLAPLSREHHEGLLFVWKLRQGLAHHIEANRITMFVTWFWQQHLAAHFLKEEQALPLVLPQTHPLLQQMFGEHEAIKKLFAEIGQHGDLKKFETLAQQLNDHIRFEERHLFEAVEKAATAEQMQMLSDQLKDEEQTAVWEDEFWGRPK